MNDDALRELKQFYALVDSKLDPIVSILKNINIYLTQNSESDSSQQQEMIHLTQLIRKKVSKVIDLSKLLEDPSKIKIQNQEQPIIFDVLTRLTKELTFESDIQVNLSLHLQNQILDETLTKSNYNEEMDIMQREINLLKEENQQLINEIQLWHKTIHEDGKSQNDLSELVRILTEKDKIIDLFKIENSQLTSKMKVDIKCNQMVNKIILQFQQFEIIVKQLQEDVEQKDESFHKQLMYKELSIDALKEQINLYEQRMKKFKKKVPIFQKSDTPETMQIANLYKVLVQLEEETFKIHKNYQARIANYTLENTELRQKLNSLEKTVNALSQSQTDNLHIMMKMKVQGEKIALMQFQNDQMKEVLRDRSMLEKRIKELTNLEQKHKDQKIKDEKDQKKLQESRNKEEKDKKKQLEESKAKEQKLKK